MKCSVNFGYHELLENEFEVSVLFGFSLLIASVCADEFIFKVR